MGKRFQFPISAILLVVILFYSTQIVLAAPFVEITYFLPGTCDDSGWELRAQTLSWDVTGLSNITFDELKQVNGNVVHTKPDIPYDFPSMKENITFQYSDSLAIGGPGTTMPYNFSFVVTWKSNGQTFGQHTIVGRCENGVATATVDNTIYEITGGGSVDPANETEQARGITRVFDDGIVIARQPNSDYHYYFADGCFIGITTNLTIQNANLGTRYLVQNVEEGCGGYRIDVWSLGYPACQIQMNMYGPNGYERVLTLPAQPNSPSCVPNE